MNTLVCFTLDTKPHGHSVLAEVITTNPLVARVSVFRHSHPTAGAHQTRRTRSPDTKLGLTTYLLSEFPGDENPHRFVFKKKWESPSASGVQVTVRQYNGEYVSPCTCDCQDAVYRDRANDCKHCKILYTILTRLAEEVPHECISDGGGR